MGLGRTIELTLQSRPGATRELRTAVDRMADACGLGADDRFDLKLAATEALTNALKRVPAGQSVSVTLTADDEAIDVEVVDTGVFSPLRAALNDGPEAEGGRGIPIMLALVDKVEFAQTGGVSRVRMRKRVASVGGRYPASGNGNAAFG